MSAADLIRQALADAPDGLHVARDGWDELDIFDGVDRPCIQRGQAAMRLIGLLLAAAPHLADALDPHRMSPEHLVQAARAITEAAQAMETES